mmetsp:Transcript_23407/g.72524  ORF Transcript_23407/g.72524 Transcript_23407/m.72524 type:complete len:208 (+) Transcript_23407:77-700(+)
MPNYLGRRRIHVNAGPPRRREMFRRDPAARCQRKTTSCVTTRKQTAKTQPRSQRCSQHVRHADVRRRPRALRCTPLPPGKPPWRVRATCSDGDPSGAPKGPSATLGAAKCADTWTRPWHGSPERIPPSEPGPPFRQLTSACPPARAELWFADQYLRRRLAARLGNVAAEFASVPRLRHPELAAASSRTHPPRRPTTTCTLIQGIPVP